MNLDMNGNGQTAGLTPVDNAVRYWGATDVFQHNYTAQELATILEDPGNATLLDVNGADVNPQINWQGETSLAADASSNGAWNIIIYNYNTFKST